MREGAACAGARYRSQLRVDGAERQNRMRWQSTGQLVGERFPHSGTLAPKQLLVTDRKYGRIVAVFRRARSRRLSHGSWRRDAVRHRVSLRGQRRSHCWRTHVSTTHERTQNGNPAEYHQPPSQPHPALLSRFSRGTTPSTCSPMFRSSASLAEWRLAIRLHPGCPSHRRCRLQRSVRSPRGLLFVAVCWSDARRDKPGRQRAGKLPMSVTAF